MLVPELKDQARVLEASVLVSEPLVTVKRALSCVSVSEVTPTAETAVTAVVTVLVTSTSPRVSVPDALRLAASDSVIGPRSEPTAVATMVGESFVPVTVTTKVFVPVPVAPSVMASV